ncbi:UVI-1 [Xylaria intraflava]|nr:UVI-1 [Xylaria intraflava]
MLFSKIFSGLAMAASAMAAATPQQIADGINSITQKSQALQTPAQSITVLNAPLIVIGQGPFPVLINGFTDIVSTASVLAAQIGSGSDAKKNENQKVHARDISPRDPGADLVFNSFRAFVRVHQQLLNILIGKAGLITSVPFIGPPVATVLRSVESIVDQIAIGLIDQFQDRAVDLESEANSLGATLDLTIQKYDGLTL